MNGTKKNIAQIVTGDTKIADFESTSLRKFAEAYRKSGQKLPKLYYYVSTIPIRMEGTKKVLIEGRYAIGAKTPIGIQSLAEISGRMGYKIRITAKSEDAAKALLEEVKAAINQTGRFAPKTKKIRGL